LLVPRSIPMIFAMTVLVLFGPGTGSYDFDPGAGNGMNALL
jgi:hypothetical protein